MRKIFFISIFLLVLNFTLKAQILQQPNTYGIGWKRTGADTLLYIPSDTLQVPSWGVGKTHIARKGTALYYWDGSKWSAITGAGSAYTAGNGLTLSGSQFKLGGTLSENTTIAANNYNLKIDSFGTIGFYGKSNNPDDVISKKSIYSVNTDDSGDDGLFLQSISNRNNSDFSHIRLSGGSTVIRSTQSIMINPNDSANLNIGFLQNGTINDYIMTLDSVDGWVRKRSVSDVVTNLYNSDGTLTGSRTVQLDGNTLDFQGSGAEDFTIQNVGAYYLNNVSGSIVLQNTNDSIKLQPFNGNLVIGTLKTTTSTTGKKVMIRDTTTGAVQNIDPALLGATSLPISSLTAATGTNDIDNGSNEQTWRWNSATSGTGLELASSSLSSGILLHVNATGTAAFNNLKRAFQVSMSGTNANANQTTYAARFSNASTGTGAVNIGIETQAGSSGYALIVPSNSGRVGIGTSTPDASALLDVTSTTRGAVLPRMNTTQMNAISSPVAGLMVYNSDSTSYCYYDGSRWLNVSKAQKVNLTFGAGSGADADTTAFTTSAIYGSFYNDADTIVVTSMRSVLQGTSPDVTYKVWYNDSLNVEAGATALVTAGSQVTNTTTGTNVTSFDATKIPPGVWVWVKTSTVATKPKYFSLTINGYRK